MTKKLMLVVLALSLTAFAQHGHGGMGGGSPMGGGNPMGGSSTHGMGADRDSQGGTQHSAGPKSADTLLQQNSKLSSKLEGMLPKGMTAQQACSGFKNLGQCVAAIHVSHNLGIPFADLKAKMTGDHSASLGKAIQELDPKAEAKAEAKKAERQAKNDIRETQS